MAIVLRGKEYYVDTAAELYAWDVSNVDMGTKAYVIESGKKMVLNGSKRWKDLYRGGYRSSYQEDSSALPDVTSEDNGCVLAVVNGSWDKVDSSEIGDSGFIKIYDTEETTPKKFDYSNHNVYIGSSDSPYYVKSIMYLYNMPSDYMDNPSHIAIKLYDTLENKYSWAFADIVDQVTLTEPRALGPQGLYIQNDTAAYRVTSGDKTIYIVPTDTDFWLQAPI